MENKKMPLNYILLKAAKSRFSGEKTTTDL